MKYIILLSLIFIASCKDNGTETGNPLISDVAAQSSRAYKITESACRKVISCATEIDDEDQALSQCLNKQLLSKDYVSKLGLTTDYSDWTLFEIIYAETDQKIVADEPAKIRCINQIDSLNCSNAEIQAVSIESYLGISNVLQSSCQDVFKP